MLSADQCALFNIANNFAIRHNNRQQHGDYDRVTWLRWTFYVYLATIHAVSAAAPRRGTGSSAIARAPWRVSIGADRRARRP